jgi:branched-chain amino acid transport system ATP-binding protein
VEVTVPEGTVVALLGPNGAGKTTLMRVASGLLSARRGTVSVCGVDVTRRRPSDRARAGVCLIPEGRAVFPNLSVRENLRLQVPPWQKDRSFDRALEAFPVLADRLGEPARQLSGGQQQMVALSRCFLGTPKVALLDEVSLGLAPHVIDEIFAALRRLAEKGVTLLLVEQYINRAMAIADRVCVLSRGTVSFTGAPDELDTDALYNRYLGHAV